MENINVVEENEFHFYKIHLKTSVLLLKWVVEKSLHHFLFYSVVVSK